MRTDAQVFISGTKKGSRFVCKWATRKSNSARWLAWANNTVTSGLPGHYALRAVRIWTRDGAKHEFWLGKGGEETGKIDIGYIRVLFIYLFHYLFCALQIVHDIVAVIMTFIVMIELRNTVVGLSERRGT